MGSLQHNQLCEKGHLNARFDSLTYRIKFMLFSCLFYFQQSAQSRHLGF